MIEVNRTESHLLIPFFRDTEKTMILSFLQGHMGKAWLDREDTPTCAVVAVGDFWSPAGDAGSPQAEQMVRELAREKPRLYVPPDKAWADLIRKIHGDEYTEITRYSFHKNTQFDQSRLLAFTAKLPPAYTLCRIDKDLYDQCLSDPVMTDLVSVFDDRTHYIDHGMGWCILDGEEIICGASSYTYYDDGIEIEIDTKIAYRRQGLATICAARLITDCLEKDLWPNWDAHNLNSTGLALKLGYKLDKEYPAFTRL